MANVTLLGEKLAKVGMEFYFYGPLPECKDCKVKSVCFNLEEGRTYRVVNTRDMTHECEVHEGLVVAVEYETLPLELVLEPKRAIEGSSQKVSTQICKNATCPYFHRCAKPKIRKKSAYRILSVIGDVDCPLGRSLKLVEAEPD